MSKRYGDVEAVKDFSFSVNQWEIFRIIENQKNVNRIYVNDLEKAVPFCEELFQTKATRFNYWSKGLDIAGILLVSGSDDALEFVRDAAI